VPGGEAMRPGVADILGQEVRWAECDAQEAIRVANRRLRRLCRGLPRGWPVVAISFIPFGALAFAKLHPLLAAVCTLAVAGVAVLVVDDLLLSRRELSHES
jgi:hypothetical protein